MFVPLPIFYFLFNSRSVLEVYKNLQLFAIKTCLPFLSFLLLFDKHAASSHITAGTTAADSTSFSVIPYLQDKAAANRENSKLLIMNNHHLCMSILMDLVSSSNAIKEISNMMRNNVNNQANGIISNGESSCNNANTKLSLISEYVYRNILFSLNYRFNILNNKNLNCLILILNKNEYLNIIKILIIQKTLDFKGLICFFTYRDFMYKIIKSPVDYKLVEDFLILVSGCFSVDPQLYQALTQKSYVEVLPILLDDSLLTGCVSFDPYLL